VSLLLLNGIGFLLHVLCRGFESLVLPVKINSARSVTKWDYSSPGCGLTVRMHIGLEDVQDLKDDLERGFAALKAQQLEVESNSRKD